MNRLSSLLSRFHVSQRLAADGYGNLRIFGTSDGEPTHIGFSDTANRLVANGK